MAVTQGRAPRNVGTAYLSALGLPEDRTIASAIDAEVEAAYAASAVSDLDGAAFGAQLARTAGGHAFHDADAAQAALSRRHVSELIVAFAAAHGDPPAVAEIERALVEPAPRFLSRLDGVGALVDEVRQAVRFALLVGGEGGPKLLEYRGEGPLAAWARVVTVRLAHDLLRARGASHELDDVTALELAVDTSDDPELVAVRRGANEVVRAAFHEAAASLSAEERLVLRASAVDGLTVDELGVLLQVHRSTAARRVEHAKSSLLTRLRRALGDRGVMTAAQCESLIALVGSRLDLSMARVLADH
jgi:RNA polymerase sigma-70 factor (ECF subfamily)